MVINQSFWAGKKVFITGHTGFKGSWLSLWLHSMGAEVQGYALAPNTNPNLFELVKLEQKIHSTYGDVRDQDCLNKTVLAFDPEIIFHLAAQPLVRYSYDHPIETYSTNVMGTVHILEVARQCNQLKAFIGITSDKCYENKETEHAYSENDCMGGYDPYSSSKGCSELVISAYYRSFFKYLNVGVASVRAGNVIGGGDWSNDRLIPDLLKSYGSGQATCIRSPYAIRPWQHVLEPLGGYLILAEKLYQETNFSSGWNFGPNDESVKSVEWIANFFQSNLPDFNWFLSDKTSPHEAMQLRLDSTKAQKKLNWKPIWNLAETLERIILWHQSWQNNCDMGDVCLKEINDYLNV